MKPDPYELLGVGRDADEGQIKKAFRRLARDLHPDVNRDDPDAEEKFKQAAEAYEILSDAERRAIYDRYGHDGLDSRGYASQAQGFASFADIFDAFFGRDPFGGGGFGGPAQGGDIGVAVEITLAEAATGTTREVEVEAVVGCERCGATGAEPGSGMRTCGRCGGAGQLRSVARTAFGQVVRAHACDACAGRGQVPGEPCTGCDGRGRLPTTKRFDVEIPAGISDEQRIRLSARGHAGEPGAPAGDLYVLVRVADDERFLRDGDDLVTVVDVSAFDAALGTTVTVPTLDGEEQLELVPGTQPGTILTLRGRGMPALRTGRRGDERVVVNVVVPRRLSARQRELLEELAGTVDARDLRAGADGDGDGSLLSRVRRALRS
jgi:molecular chaperone DnaJ